MKTVLVSPAKRPVVSLAEVKDYLRLSGDDDDSYLTTLIQAATGHIEQVTDRKLISQEWMAFYDEWPGGAEIILPFGNTISVGAIQYRDVYGNLSTWPTENYIVDVDTVPARIVIAYGKTWPTDALYAVNPISIQFVAGYGEFPGDVPDQIRVAVMALVAHWYENREPVRIDPGVSVAVQVPMHVESMIWPFRLFRYEDQ